MSSTVGLDLLDCIHINIERSRCYRLVENVLFVHTIEIPERSCSRKLEFTLFLSQFEYRMDDHNELYLIFSHLIGAVSSVEVSVCISDDSFLLLFLHSLLTLARMRTMNAMRRRTPMVISHTFSRQPSGGVETHEMVRSSMGCLRTASIRGRSRSVIDGMR
ncbi:hypothetical protein PMAYCL1PPCAC_28983, partial [Pristionchus mayeri]